jgi:parvulin-like peptidyl-prolyl isomerase
VNQISPVIEAPASFHIVLVENRRRAGPARFDEVQDQVRVAVADEKRKKAAGGFLADLRQNTIISTMFESPTSDHAAIKVNATQR